MTSTGSARPLGSTGFVWSLRMLWWIPVLCLLLGTAAGLLVLAQPTGYEAQAVVVARQLEADTKILPRYGSSVFNEGVVASQVAERLGIADPAGLVPDKLNVVTAEDSIVFTVVGRDPDPNVAARLATAGAAVFATELSRGGPGVGTFSAQIQATVPTEPAEAFPPVLAAVLGALLGSVLGLGIVVLITVLRRPVVASEDVRTAAGTGLFGELTVPRRPAGPVPPQDIAGIAAVARRMADLPSARFLVVSDPDDTALRQRALIALGAVLAGQRTTYLYGDPSLNDELRRMCETPVHDPGRAPIVLIDQSEPLALLDETEAPLMVLVVARKGMAASRLRAVTAEHVPSELLGVILVEAGRPPRRVEPDVPATAPATEGTSV